MRGALSGFFSITLVFLGIAAVGNSPPGWSGNAVMMERMAQDLTDLNERILSPLVGRVSDGYYQLKAAILKDDQIANLELTRAEEYPAYGILSTRYGAPKSTITIRSLDIPIIPVGSSQSGYFDSTTRLPGLVIPEPLWADPVSGSHNPGHKVSGQAPRNED